MCLIAGLGALGSAMGATATAAQTAAGVYSAAQVAVGALTAGNIALGAYTAYSSTAAQKQQEQYQEGVAETNRVLAEQNAKEAKRIGFEEAQRKFREVSTMRKGQEATASASGVVASAGSTGDIIKATDYFGRADAQTIATNARKQAWGSEMEAMNYGTSASMHRSAARYYSPGLSVGVSLLQGGGNIAEKWLTRP